MRRISNGHHHISKTTSKKYNNKNKVSTLDQTSLEEKKRIEKKEKEKESYGRQAAENVKGE